MNVGMLKSVKWTYRTITLVLLLFFFVACGTTSMYFSVTRPAEINLKNFKKIAMGDFTGSTYRTRGHANDVRDSLTNALFTSERFEVVDREHIQKIIEEQKLGHSGMVDENTAGELGKFVGAAAFVFGRVQTSNYNETTEKGSSYTTKEGNRRTTYYRKGVYTLNVNVKLIDINTARIIAMKTINSKSSKRTSATNQSAPSIDSQALYSKALQDVTKKFMKMIAPYKEQVRASFQTDKLLPEVDQAIALFKIEEWDEGLQLLDSATHKDGLVPEVKAKTYYNLGLAQTYTGEFDEALINIKKAFKLIPTSSAYKKALLKVKNEKKKADKLKKQM